MLVPCRVEPATVTGQPVDSSIVQTVGHGTEQERHVERLPNWQGHGMPQREVAALADPKHERSGRHGRQAEATQTIRRRRHRASEHHHVRARDRPVENVRHGTEYAAAAAADHNWLELLRHRRHARGDFRFSAVDDDGDFERIEAKSPEEKTLLSLRETVELEPSVGARNGLSSRHHGENLDLIDWLPRDVADRTTDRARVDLRRE